jgi:hypothetical protein
MAALQNNTPHLVSRIYFDVTCRVAQGEIKKKKKKKRYMKEENLASSKEKEQ